MRRPTRGCLILLIAIVAMIFIPAAFLTFTPLRNGINVTPQTVAPQTFNLAKGTVTVPGTAYIDDLDPTANVRAGLINIWYGVGSTRGRVVCSLTDGYEVRLIAAQDVPDAVGEST